MKRPITSWLLILTLIVLALGGFAGAYGFLSDPTGSSMGMASALPLLPVPDYTLPGIFLLLAFSIYPLLLIYGLSTRKEWKAIQGLAKWSNRHWAWAGSLLLGIVLGIWLLAQAALIGFKAPIQWFTAFLDLSILITTLMPSTCIFYTYG
jgi:hypothetical protein